jgi:hypothetical protein
VQFGQRGVEVEGTAASSISPSKATLRVYFETFIDIAREGVPAGREETVLLVYGGGKAVVRVP